MIRGSKRKGNALIEFALACGILIPAMLATFQFGYSFYYYNNLQNRVRGAGRYAATRTYDSATNTPSNNYKNAVSNMVMNGTTSTSAPQVGVTPGGDEYRLVNPINPDNIDIVMTFTDGVPGSVTVKLKNYEMDAFFTKFRLSGKPSVTFPFIGRWDPVQ